MDSRAKKDKVGNAERWIGFFAAPSGALILNCIVISYLNIFYTDVIHAGAIWGGSFLLLMPIVSKLLDAVTNIVMGQIIEKTLTRQGKARPWMLLSAPVMALAAVLAFAIPKASETVQVIWIIISYNLYFSIGYTMYYMSHSVMVPLSTRDLKARDGLSIASMMSQALIPGAFVAMLFPMLILPAIGVDQNKWLMLVSVFAIICLPCVIIEYFYTRERITEEQMLNGETAVESSSLQEQMHACIHSKYWIMIILIFILTQIGTNMQNMAGLYFANWVLGTYNDGTTMALLSVAGNFPLGLGIPLIWPLVHKFGKQKVMIVGSIIAAAAGLAFLFNPTNMPYVLVTLIIRAFGYLPAGYLLMALHADAMDHIEWQSGIRVDGFSTSIYTIICTVIAGVCQGVFNIFLTTLGYVPPAVDGSWVVQNDAVKSFFCWSYQGIYAVMMILVVIVCIFYKVEKELPGIHAEIAARKAAKQAD